MLVQLVHQEFLILEYVMVNALKIHILLIINVMYVIPPAWVAMEVQMQTALNVLMDISMSVDIV
jgi:hypothetical protein